jgi:protein subunit release factor A
MNKEKVLLFSQTAKDFNFDFFSAGGPGGQHMQKSATAARCTHPASGAVGISRDERSQLRNKELAFLRCVESEKWQNWHRVECARRLGQKLDEEKKQTAGFRSEKIRSYNEKRNQVTNHLTGTDFYNMQEILDGNLDVIINDNLVNIKQDEQISPEVSSHFGYSKRII